MFCKKNVPKDFAIFTDLQLYEKENVAKFLKIIILKILRMAASGPTSLYFNTILLCSVKIRQKYFKGINHCPSHSD